MAAAGAGRTGALPVALVFSIYIGRPAGAGRWACWPWCSAGFFIYSVEHRRSPTATCSRAWPACCCSSPSRCSTRCRSASPTTRRTTCSASSAPRDYLLDQAAPDEEHALGLHAARRRRRIPHRAHAAARGRGRTRSGQARRAAGGQLRIDAAGLALGTAAGTDRDAAAGPGQLPYQRAAVAARVVEAPRRADADQAAAARRRACCSYAGLREFGAARARCGRPMPMAR